jgi:hypothetical protein
MSGWPSEFLGRCAHCLDNAYLDQREPCWDRFTGREVPDYDCLVLKVRRVLGQEDKG